MERAAAAAAAQTQADEMAAARAAAQIEAELAAAEETKAALAATKKIERELAVAAKEAKIEANKAAKAARVQARAEAAKAEEARLLETAATTDDDAPVTEMFSTTSLPAMVFAVAGAVILPTADVAGPAIALLNMINANRSADSPELFLLPGLVELFRLLNVPIALSDKAGHTTLFPPSIPDESLRHRLFHNGRGTRIGPTLAVAFNPAWTRVSKGDIQAGSYTMLATLGFRRFGEWRLPEEGGVSDVNLGARRKRADSPQHRSPTVPRSCGTYTQGASNADACVTCGRTSGEHKVSAEQAFPDDHPAGQLSTPSSPFSYTSADLRAKFSPGAISNISSDRTTNAILAQPAQKLLSWSKFEYADWKTVRDAAKLAYATGSRDHQRYHLSEDMEYVLSAYCDRYAGNLGDKSKKGQAFKYLNERPLDEWIKTVDAMMRKVFKVPEFDKLELDLLRDDKGRPALDAWRAAWLIFEQQENYHDEKDRLMLLRESVEKNFKEVTAERLEPEYKRWRRDKTPLLEAIFAVCDVLEPFTSSSIKLGKTGGAKATPKDWKRFFCVNCKANDTHDSAGCHKVPIDKKTFRKARPREELSCFTCKATDHKSEECPKKPKDTCSLCKKPGHLVETCFHNPSYKPPVGYTCRRCNKSGHFVQQCKADPAKK
jgi:hypothetical protein